VVLRGTQWSTTIRPVCVQCVLSDDHHPCVVIDHQEIAVDLKCVVMENGIIDCKVSITLLCHLLCAYAFVYVCVCACVRACVHACVFVYVSITHLTHC